MIIRNLLILAVLLISGNIQADDKEYIIDDTHFSLGFLVEHAGYAKTLGIFREIEGSFTYDEETNIVKDININVKTNSVFTNHEGRDSHLRSPDFLNTDQYPNMVFKSKTNNLNNKPGKITGELTLIGMTRPLVLNAKINKIAQYPFRVGLFKPIVMGVSANTSFKRSDFGMNYGVDKKFVGDKIELIIEFEAIQQ
jgi:polyisoprenoid-binding protein YceI|tara:strand:+ start:913 stop:1500 length:588 start_codon:yes stop_codon:yes gene_type:complete